MCLADVAWEDGSDVVASPRQVLRRQLARLAERGWSANAGTELEFIVFRDTYEQAWHKGYRELEPANLYNVDYSLLGTARVEPLIRRIRNSMEAAGMLVRGLQGRVQLRPARDQLPLRRRAAHAPTSTRSTRTAPRRSPRSGGHVDHVHGQVRRARGQLVPHPLLARRRARARCSPATARCSSPSSPASSPCLRELTLLLAPNINSYKRFAAGQLRADGGRVGPRQPHLLAARRRRTGPSLRFENRVGGADLNPYMALSAIIAAGLHGVDQGLELEPAFEGNAYAATEKPRLPGSLRDARELFAASAIARAAFGEEVVDHYVNAADVELAAFGAAVTDWERFRGFERL